MPRSDRPCCFRSRRTGASSTARAVASALYLIARSAPVASSRTPRCSRRQCRLGSSRNSARLVLRHGGVDVQHEVRILEGGNYRCDRKEKRERAFGKCLEAILNVKKGLPSVNCMHQQRCRALAIPPGGCKVWRCSRSRRLRRNSTPLQGCEIPIFAYRLLTVIPCQATYLPIAAAKLLILLVQLGGLEPPTS